MDSFIQSGGVGTNKRARAEQEAGVLPARPAAEDRQIWSRDSRLGIHRGGADVTHLEEVTEEKPG